MTVFLSSINCGAFVALLLFFYQLRRLLSKI